VSLRGGDNDKGWTCTEHPQSGGNSSEYCFVICGLRSTARICSCSGIAARGGRSPNSSESGSGRRLSGRAPLPAVEVCGQPTGDPSRIAQTVSALSVIAIEAIPSPAALLTSVSRVACATMCLREHGDGPQTCPVALGAIAAVPRTVASAAPS